MSHAWLDQEFLFITLCSRNRRVSAGLFASFFVVVAKSMIIEPVDALSQSATKDDIRAENKLQSIFKLFIPRVSIPQVSFLQTTTQILSTISELNPVFV